MNQKIENGKDEVTVFEYLKDSIQATANAFKRSFLDHLKVVENLTTEDLNTLQRSGYLLTQNTKRLDEIKESFQATISGENTNPNKIIDGDDGIDVREKLLKILNLVLEAPDNLIHLKNLTGSIIKINESQREMLSKHSNIERMKPLKMAMAMKPIGKVGSPVLFSDSDYSSDRKWMMNPDGTITNQYLGNNYCLSLNQDNSTEAGKYSLLELLYLIYFFLYIFLVFQNILHKIFQPLQEKSFFSNI